MNSKNTQITTNAAGAKRDAILRGYRNKIPAAKPALLKTKTALRVGFVL